jgi:hypothetical protein
MDNKRLNSLNGKYYFVRKGEYEGNTSFKHERLPQIFNYSLPLKSKLNEFTQ